MPAQSTAEGPTGTYGERFAEELLRHTGSRRGERLVAALRQMGPVELRHKLAPRLAWLGPEWLKKMEHVSPEEFARAIVREETWRGHEEGVSSTVAYSLLRFLEFGLLIPWQREAAEPGVGAAEGRSTSLAGPSQRQCARW